MELININNNNNKFLKEETLHKNINNLKYAYINIFKYVYLIIINARIPTISFIILYIDIYTYMHAL